MHVLFQYLDTAISAVDGRLLGIVLEDHQTDRSAPSELGTRGMEKIWAFPIWLGAFVLEKPVSGRPALNPPRTFKQVIRLPSRMVSAIALGMCLPTVRTIKSEMTRPEIGN